MGYAEKVFLRRHHESLISILLGILIENTFKSIFRFLTEKIMKLLSKFYK